jgi:hypothetical protein
MEIKLLKRNEIETAKWNGCIHYSSNSRIYGYSWYLDNVADDWWGLVEGDYESVMPLVWNDKLLKTKQIYQPFLTQQLGLFSMNICSKARIEFFLNAIPAEFRYVDMQLNFLNTDIAEFKNWKIELRTNFILDLKRPYEEIQKGYSNNLRRILKKQTEANLYATTDLKPETFISQVREFHTAQKNNIPEAFYHTALRVIYNCLHRGQGTIFAIFDTEKRLCAAAFIVFDSYRLVNVINFSTEIGKELNAMHFLFDGLIQNNANTLKIFDFEGSNIEGVARFYESFGAINQPYPRLKYNNLPWYLKIVKK